MKWNRIDGNWQRAQAKIRTQWARFTDDHLGRVAGTRNQLIANVQHSYGISMDAAARQVDAWEAQNKGASAGSARPPGTRAQLVGNIHESYGISRNAAERQVKAWGAKNATRIAQYEKTTGGPWEHWPHT